MLAAFLGAMFGFLVVSTIVYTYFKHMIQPRHGVLTLPPASPRSGDDRALTPAEIDIVHRQLAGAIPEVSLDVIVQITSKLEGHWRELRKKCGCELCMEIFRIYGGPNEAAPPQAPQGSA